MVVKAGSPGIRLYVLRHGEPERLDLFYGHHDIALSPKGQRQAQGQARCLGDIPFVAIYSSDSQRAIYGARLIAARRELDIRVRPQLREMSLGSLEAVPHAEAMRRAPQWASRPYFDMLDARMPGGGESVRDLAERVLPTVEGIARAHAAEPTAGRWPTVLIYAHNTVARVVLAQAAGVGVRGYPRFSQRYGAINRIDIGVDPQRVESDDGPFLDWDHAQIGYTNRDPLAPSALER